MGEIRNAFSILVGKRERKSPLRTLMRTWEDNNRMDLEKLDGKIWIEFNRPRTGTNGGLL
jgi:hypothetical protein